MKHINFDRKKQRSLRHKRITKTLTRCEDLRPRLVVTKTTHHIYAQIIDDTTHKVLAASSSLTFKINKKNIETAKTVGADIAKKAVALKIKNIAFDRGGNKYHGQIKVLADAVRENGLNF